MITPRCCNYNIDYQQRLGFLKVVCVVAEHARGGTPEILERLRALYPDARGPVAMQSRPEPFDPVSLLRRDDVPSWQPGFTFQRLDRLVLWAEMLGIIAPNGRLSEWARMLQALDPRDGAHSWASHNPFVLPIRERTFFVQLLCYHDHALPLLISHLGKLEPGTRIRAKEACVLITRALSDLLQEAQGQGPEELDLRTALRDVLERIGERYRIAEPRRLQSSQHRQSALGDIEAARGRRVHLAEYHAVCRFEQLTDLGLLTKESIDDPPADDAARAEARTAWLWYVTPALIAASKVLGEHGTDMERFITMGWMSFCEVGFNHPCRRLSPIHDQATLAKFLDDSLSQARRQLGPVQVHTWASIAILRAFEAGILFELDDVFHLLDRLRTVPEAGELVRLGGRKSLHGRTASVGHGSLAATLSTHPIHLGADDDCR